MQVKRFVAADMRRALELVRQELGPDAVILSSQRHPKGVELLTTLEELPRVPEEVQGLVPGIDNSVGDESPLASDAAWGDQAVVSDAVKAHFDSRQSDPQSELQQAGFPGGAHPTENENPIPTAFAGRTSQQLAAEIELARERMFSARKAEAKQEEGEATSFSSQLQQATEMAGTHRSQPASSQPNAAQPASLQQEARAQETRAQQGGVRSVADQQGAYAQPNGPQAASSSHDDAMKTLQEELASMRTMLHEQLGRMSYGHMATHSPVQANIWRRFSRMGLSPQCADSVLKAIVSKDYQTVSEAWPAAMAALSHQLPTLPHDVADRGGIIALVGPTGAGKTTTIGKLAARYVLKHGADKVALVTTDTYRLAAHDQLRSLGRILNVTVKLVNDQQELPGILDSVSHCSLVLIDTAGFRHGDPLLNKQLEMLRQNPAIDSYLVLPCNSQEQMMKASLIAYQQAGLKGCVLTKLDETASLGEAIGVLAENRLPLAYTTDGQHIPNDIDLARGHQLVTRAVALMKQKPLDEQRAINDFASVAVTVPQSPIAKTAEHL